jgi:hypothetical protein
MKIASSTSCVTNRTVFRSASQMPSSSSCISTRVWLSRRAERLVEQQDLRIVGERAGERRALLHSAESCFG